jgi:hypothetical protein
MRKIYRVSKRTNKKNKVSKRTNKKKVSKRTNKKRVSKRTNKKKVSKRTKRNTKKGGMPGVINESNHSQPQFINPFLPVESNDSNFNGDVSNSNTVMETNASNVNGDVSNSNTVMETNDSNVDISNANDDVNNLNTVVTEPTNNNIIGSIIPDFNNINIDTEFVEIEEMYSKYRLRYKKGNAKLVITLVFDFVENKNVTFSIDSNYPNHIKNEPTYSYLIRKYAYYLIGYAYNKLNNKPPPWAGSYNVQPIQISGDIPYDITEIITFFNKLPISVRNLSHLSDYIQNNKGVTASRIGH